MTEAVAQQPKMMEFHADVVQEVLDEFPHYREKAERLIREKKIRVLPDEHKETENVRSKIDKKR